MVSTSTSLSVNQKGVAPVLVVLVIATVAAVSVGSFLIYSNYSNNRSKITPAPNQVACTQEVKLCPDGTSVGRTGPNCEFAECPIPPKSTSSDDTTNWKTYTNTKYGFVMKYPANWLVEDLVSVSPDLFTTFFQSSDFKKDKYTPDLLRGSFAYIRVTHTQNNLDPIEQNIKEGLPPNTGGLPLSVWRERR